MMGNIFIFSILMGLASALVLFPFTKEASACTGKG